MTLKRIGPALAANGVGAVASNRRYCPQCVNEMKCHEGGIIWEPLVWSLSSLTCCPIHNEPLHFACSERGELVERQSELPDCLRHDRRDNCEDWQRAESLKLAAFCAEDPDDQVTKDAPKVFLNTYMQYRSMALADFCQITGLPYGNLKRQTEGKIGFTLRTVFKIAQRLALSPTDVLAEPVETARKDSLFSVANHGDDAATSALPDMRRNHAKQVYGELLKDIQNLLASDPLLPSLRSVCHARGVSTGYARYRMPKDVAEFMARHQREAMAQHMKRWKEATDAAKAALAEAGSCRPSLKRTERLLREKTGLPKHLLSPALREAALSRCK